MVVPYMIPINFLKLIKTDFYKNCKRQRAKKILPKCCCDCPLKEIIERGEKNYDP